MYAAITQIVGLTCHGNAFLEGHVDETFFPDNTIFRYCAKVNFAVLNKSLFGGMRVREVAKTPHAWFASLTGGGALGIRLNHTAVNESELSDRMATASAGGGGIWAMEVLFPGDHSEHWVARWEEERPDAPDQRGWRVCYRRQRTGNTIRMARLPLDSVMQRLDRSLRDIHAFSSAHGYDQFTQKFVAALNILDTKGPYSSATDGDLAPEGMLSVEALKLLDACQQAWVFGGVGSWNDLPDNQAYDRVSEQLYRNINQSIAAAASASCVV